VKAERLDKLKALKADIQAKLKGKKFGTLASKDKDELLKAIAKLLGLIE
jgi:succinyl-CoA synthetase beta subunit